MAMNTETFLKTVALQDFEDPFLVESDRRTFDFQKVFTVRNMKYKTWQTYTWAGFGAPRVTDELEAIRFEDAEELRKATFPAVKYTNGFTISEELESDNRNLKGLLGDFASDMGNSFSFARERFMTSLFNNAFVNYAGNYTPTEGEAMCQADHVLAKTTTVNISNFGGAVDPSYGSIYDAVDYFRQGIYNEAGIPTSCEAAYVFCHPKLSRLVEKVLNPVGGFQPDTSDRNSHNLPKIGIVYNRLLDENKWFVVGSRFNRHCHFRIRWAPRTAWDSSFLNQGRKCSTTMRISRGTTDYRFVYGYQTA